MFKRLLPLLGLVLGASLGAVTVPARAAEQVEINFVSWGGAYTKSQVKAMIEPYQQQNPHVKINVIDYIGGLAQIKAQIEAGKVTWQIVDVTAQHGVSGCDEGLFEVLDGTSFPPGADGTPAEEDFIEGALLKCFIGNISWATVMAYNSRLVAGTPNSVKDFWNVAKFPGKRGLRKVPSANIEWALEAAGVARADIYETLLDDAAIDTAFELLDEIKPHAVWWEAGAQPPQLLADGEVAFSTAWNGRLHNAIVNENQPIVMMWDTQIFDLDGFVVPKGALHLDEVMAFLHFATGTKALAKATQYISYGPLRKSATPFIDPEILPHLPTAPDNFKHALQYNVEWWADRLVELTERFNAWLAK